MKAIVTVIATDRVGIIASVCNLLADQGVNVLDLSQTVMRDYFTMIMLVDTKSCKVSFTELGAILAEAGQKEGLTIRIQREDIFEAMHRI